MYVGVAPISVGLPRPLPYIVEAILYVLGAHFVSHRCQAGARGPVIPVRTEAINPGGTCSSVEREPATLLLPKDIMCDCISGAW